MLCAGSVQEAHDFALVAHAATLRSRIPFMHFFDGFRTSHEVDKIALLGEDDLRALVPEDALLAHRARGLSPDTPTIRGTAQNPDVFFQAREAANRFHDAVPEVVRDAFDTLAERTGRRYSLVDYTGAPDAERVLVIMGAGAGAAAETVDELVRGGAKVGLVTVRLYRPFPAAALLGALPATVTRMTVLDRTKEPGSVGEAPLHRRARCPGRAGPRRGAGHRGPLRTGEQGVHARDGKGCARRAGGPRSAAARHHRHRRRRDAPVGRARSGIHGAQGRAAGRLLRPGLRRHRFAQLVRTQPERADQLMQQLQADVDRRWDYYAALAVETSPRRT
jgi:hypothetical protein